MRNVHDYSTLFYFNPLPNWVYDRETFEILDVNQSAIDHYGYSKEEFLSMTIRDLRPREEISKLHAAHAEVHAKKGNIYFGTFTHQKKNGEKIRVDVNGHQVEFMDRNCLMVTCQDVTERERQLLELKESEQKLKTASSIARLGYWRKEMDSNTLTWSDEVYRIWGRKKSEFEVNFENFFATIHPADRALFEREQNAVINGDNMLDFSHRILLPNGALRWVHELGRLNRSAEGVPVSFEGTVQDITAQKREEQQLKLLESVVTHTNDAILITEAEPLDDPGPIIVYVNEAFTRMTGYTAKEVIGKSPRILQGPKSDKKELAKLGLALRNRESCEITTVNYKKSGEEFWINFSVSPVADDKGRFTHWISIERDVSAAKNEQIQKDLLAKISTVFNQEIDLDASLQEVCRLIVNHGEFSFCEIWLPDIHKNGLKRTSFCTQDAVGKAFYSHAEGRTKMDTGEGIPGTVLLENKPVIWEDMGTSESFATNHAAQAAGIKAVLGIPLIHQDNNVGVMVIGTAIDVGKVKEHRPVLTKLQSFIGSEINRKRLEGELSHLFEALPDIICLMDLKGNFLKINKTGCELLGYDEAEILGNPLAKFIHPDDETVTAGEIWKLCQGEPVFKFENRLLNKSGKLLWLSWHGNSNLAEGVIYASGKNITDEKKLEVLVGDASQLAKIGSWELDLTNHEDADTMYWSPMVKKLLEVEEDYNPSLTGGFEFYAEESKTKIMAAVDQLVQYGIEFDLELLLVTKSGKEKWVRCIGKSERTNGVCSKIFGSFQDIDSMKSTELQLSEILESISDAFYAVDRDWNFTYFNKEAEHLLNMSSMDLLGKNIWEEFPQAKGTDLEKIYRRVAAQGKAKNFEYFYPGDSCWYEINTYPSKGGISSYFKNIDEKRRSAEELKNAYEEKNQILESIGDAFFAVDKQWKVTYWNKEAENILGRSREVMVGKNLWQEYADAIDTNFYLQYHKAMASDESVSFEEFYPTLNKWFEVVAYPGNEGLSVYFKDITLRKVTDLQILRANERFEKVTQATADAIWDWDIENDTFYRGMGFERFFGHGVKRNLTSADFWLDSFHPEDLPAIIRGLEESLADPDQGNWQMEYRVIDGDGNKKTVIDKGMIIRNEAGKAIRMVGAITDISERKKHEKEIQELNQILQENINELRITNEQLEQFAYIASHDLQEPLRMVSSFLNQLERKYGNQLDDKAHQYIHFATDGAKRMKQIILDLLEYSRAGKLGDTPERVDLNELVHEYQILRRKLLHEKKAKLIFGILPSVKCFKAPLIQTLHCLLDNSVKYSREGVPPIIKILASESDNDWQLSISDNGIGIDPLFFEKIFIIFQRLHNRDRFEGTGIGLSIAKKHVESWGGNIWVESRPGKGSTFYFTIDKGLG